MRWVNLAVASATPALYGAWALLWHLALATPGALRPAWGMDLYGVRLMAWWFEWGGLGLGALTLWLPLLAWREMQAK